MPIGTIATQDASPSGDMSPRHLFGMVHILRAEAGLYWHFASSRLMAAELDEQGHIVGMF